MAKSQSLPYFRWWVKDADTDEFYITASDAELGFYHRCLNRSWLNGGLPADPSARARLMGKPKAYVDKMWKVVGVKFTPSDSDPTRVINRKQEDERQWAQMKSERNSNAVRTRYERSSSVASNESSNELQRASGSESGSVSVSVPEKKNTEVSLPPGYAFDEQYEQFRNECKSWGMNVVDPEDFIESWWPWAKLDGLQRAEAIAGLVARRTAGADPQFSKSPKNYLYGREWKRAIRGSSQSQRPVRSRMSGV